jgi:hypothetical protein
MNIQFVPARSALLKQENVIINIRGFNMHGPPEWPPRERGRSFT